MADETNKVPVDAEHAPEMMKDEPRVAEKADSSDVERNVSITEKGWMYRPFKVGRNTIWYASPPVQLVLVAFVCFMCPGMFNAVNGLGAAGQVDPTTSNNAFISLYATFCVVGFGAGSIVNRLGIRLTLMFSGVGYVLYIASFLSYNHNGNVGFVIFAGAFLGVCAGCLWSAQGAIMMSYPTEENKGKYIAWFWGIFNLGGVLGSLIPLGQNLNNNTGVVTDGTYAAFIVLMFIGTALAWSLVDASKVIRKDGSKVILMKQPSWKTEVTGLFQVLVTDYYIILMFPMFFASNFFYVYQFNDVNLARFQVATRSLNGVLYWGAQIVGAGIFGYCLDMKRFSRPARAKGCLAALFAITMVIWGGGFAFQRQYERNPLCTSTVKADLAACEDAKMKWTTDGYVGPMFLYIFYGFFDAAWQTSVYWLMGCLSNNSRKLANFAGFYKGIQSAGAAVAAAVDNTGPAYVNELAANWGMLAGSLLIAAPLILYKVKESVPIEEDLKFSDETYEDVKAKPEIVQI